MPPWAGEWVGIPYEHAGRSRSGFDCFGLYAALMLDRKHIAVFDPKFTVVSAVGSDHLSRYRRVAISDAAEGDAVVMRFRGFPIHVGYCIDATWMLHTTPALGSVGARWQSSEWKCRIEGIYRHA